ncbi:substrate-binding domain-containing protein [Streptomyces coeruleorubidus]|uniref:substrate-binding domain-containing protein n=1 Tax=Streptomyces coeruleorubidus TaxID=116188 RepID=UPI0037FA3EB3
MRAPGPEQWTDVVSTSRRYAQEGGYQGAKRLLSRPDRPTAVFAGADIAAMGAFEAVTEAGLSVPEASPSRGVRGPCRRRDRTIAAQGSPPGSGCASRADYRRAS